MINSNVVNMVYILFIAGQEALNGAATLPSRPVCTKVVFTISTASLRLISLCNTFSYRISFSLQRQLAAEVLPMLLRELVRGHPQNRSELRQSKSRLLTTARN